MEKVEEKIVEVKRKVHKFYCDKCGEYLGESEEYDDGYYEEIGYIYEDIVVDETPYRYIGYLCNNCKEKHFKELGSFLETIEFVKNE